MTQEELDAIVDAKLAAALAARLEADRARIRLEVVSELRRAAEKAHYDKINARAPIEDKYGGLGPEGHAARLAAMDAAARKTCAEMDAVNQRPIEGSLLDQRKRAALVPGAEGFRFKQA